MCMLRHGDVYIQGGGEGKQGGAPETQGECERERENIKSRERGGGGGVDMISGVQQHV